MRAPVGVVPPISRRRRSAGQVREWAMRGNSLSTMGARRAYCCWGRCITSRLNARATSQLYGVGNTCSADGMRFYVPVDILAADFSMLPAWSRRHALRAHRRKHNAYSGACKAASCRFTE